MPLSGPHAGYPPTGNLLNVAHAMSELVFGRKREKEAKKTGPDNIPIWWSSGIWLGLSKGDAWG